MSVIAFWSPAMWSIVIGQTLFVLKRRARMQISCSTTRLALDAIHCTRPTVGLLLLNSATLFLVRRPQTCSIISQRMTSPASSRSEFVSFPLGFLSETTLAVISRGHCSRKTVGRHAESLPIMIPLMPWLDASTTPKKSGQPATNSRHQVGRCVDSRRIVQQSDMAKRRGSLRWKKTTGGRRLRSRLHGDRSPRPPGRAVKACRSFATTDSNSANGTPRFWVPARIQLCRMVKSFARFSSSNQSVFCCPSNLKPRIVFISAYCPSPFSSFSWIWGRCCQPNLLGRHRECHSLLPLPRG